MLTKGHNSVRSSNNVNTTELWEDGIFQTNKQNLIKFIMHLHHEVQSAFSILEEIFHFSGKHFYQPLIFEKQTGSGRNTNKFQTKKML